MLCSRLIVIDYSEKGKTIHTEYYIVIEAFKDENWKSSFTKTHSHKLVTMAKLLQLGFELLPQFFRFSPQRMLTVPKTQENASRKDYISN